MPRLTRNDEAALRALYHRWRQVSDQIDTLAHRRAELDGELRAADDAGADLAVACKIVSPSGTEDWTQAIERVGLDKTVAEASGSV